MNRLPCPDFGLHQDVPADTYHAWDALSCGVMLRGIDEGELNMKALRHAMDHPSEATPAMRLGTMTHAAILEPKRFLESLIEPPVNPKTGKPFGADTQAFADYMAQHPGKVCLARGDVDAIQGMIDAAQENPLARGALFAARRVAECSIVFRAETPGGGMRFKVRPDCLTDTALVDLKTVRPMTTRALGVYAWKAGWYHRCVMYRRGLAAVKQGARDWVWVVIDNEAPFDVQVLEPEPAAVMAAEEECDCVLAEYESCLTSGLWPGKGGATPAVRPLAIPSYVLTRVMADAENRAAFAEPAAA